MSLSGLTPHVATSGFETAPALKTSPWITLSRVGIALLALLSLSFLARSETLKPEEIYQKLLPSVMTLRVENASGEVYVGTAFLALDKNIAITAWHVVADAAKVSAKFSDDHVINVDGFIDKDEKHDLALIHLNGTNRPAAHLSMAVAPVGSRAYVIGAPKGFDFSITDGLISQIQKIHGYSQYQVSCPISGGNSGGPVVNDRGEVIGITAWTKRDAQNLNFAIPTGFIAQMDANRVVTPWMELPAPKSSALTEAPSDSVTASEPQSSVGELKNVLNNSAGKEVTITITEGGEEKKFNVVSAKRLRQVGTFRWFDFLLPLHPPWYDLQHP